MTLIKMNWLGKFKYFVPLVALVLTLGIMPAPAANAFACNEKPAKPQMQIPSQSATVSSRRVKLGWKSTDCATHYQVEIRQGTEWGRPLDANYDLTKTHYRTRKLQRGQTYWWHVEACNPHGCKVSKWGTFSVSE